MFKQKCQQILNHQLPDLTVQGYDTARTRSIEKIGAKLKNVYLYAEKLRLVYQGIF